MQTCHPIIFKLQLSCIATIEFVHQQPGVFPVKFIMSSPPPTYELAPCHTAQGLSTALMLYFISTTFFFFFQKIVDYLIRAHLILPRAAVK